MNKNQQVIFHQGFDQESGRFVKFKLQNSPTAPLWKSLTRSFSRPEDRKLHHPTEFGPLFVDFGPDHAQRRQRAQ